MVKLVAWNIARREEAWRALLDSGADVALLQEATEPPADVARRVDVGPSPWRTAGAGLQRPWRAAVVKLSDRVDVEWLELKPVDEASRQDLMVSRPGTLDAAILTAPDAEPVIVASMYAAWEQSYGVLTSGWIYADASAHRLISDLSALVGREAGHRIVVAGDLNILHGYGEQGSPYWASRYDTVFSRMQALGLSFVGPQSPAGRQAAPWPDELPTTSKDVPTYYASHQTPATATRQLDFVFASRGMKEHVCVRALNDPDGWGPSDHCRVEIEVSC